MTAQNDTIKIQIVDAINKEALFGANVYWSDTTIGTITDAEGWATLLRLPTKNPVLRIDYVGYVSDSIRLDEHQSKYSVLLKTQNILHEVEVKAKKQSNFISTLETHKTEKITFDEMKKAACCNLSESFQTNASIDVNYSNAVTGAKEIKLLGLSGLYVQNLMEGIPFMRRYSYAFSLDQLPASWINSISISKGIPSVKNNYDGISGSMSIDLKNGFNDKNRAYFDMFGNSEGRIETNLVLNHKINPYLSTSIMLNGAFRPLKMDKNKDGFLDNPLMKQYNFLNSWNVHRSDKNIEGQYRIKVTSDDRNAGQNQTHQHLLSDTLSPYLIHIKIKRAEVFAKTGFILKKHNSSIGTQFSGIYHMQQSNYGSKDYQAAQATFTGNLMYQTDINNENHQMVSGASFTFDKLSEKLDALHQNEQLIMPGIFSEYTFKHDDIITIIAGFRMDYSKVSGFQFNPRVHARFVLDKKENITLRLAAGKGFRIADVLNENQSLFASSRTFVFKDQQSLESAWNYGISLHQKFKIKQHESSFTFDFFRTDFTKQTTIDIEGADNLVSVYAKEGKSYSNSLLAELNLDVAEGLSIKAAYKWEDVQMAYHSVRLQKALHNIHRGLFAVDYTIPNDKLQFNLTMPILGKMRLPNSFEGDAGNRFSKPYVMLNFQILAKFKIAELYAGVENMTNFKQKNPVLGIPYSSYFDSYQVWAPISGVTGYGGFRIFIK